MNTSVYINWNDILYIHKNNVYYFAENISLKCTLNRKCLLSSSKYPNLAEIQFSTTSKSKLQRPTISPRAPISFWNAKGLENSMHREIGSVCISHLGVIVKA